MHKSGKKILKNGNEGKTEMSSISTVKQDIGFTHQKFRFIHLRNIYIIDVFENCLTFVELQDDTMSLIHLHLSSV